MAGDGGIEWRCRLCGKDGLYCGCSISDNVARTGGLMVSSEVRITDATTGGEKGQKLARFSLIPRDFLWALAEHYGRGARKYEDRNWERGYRWSLSLDALDRHLALWLMGEDDDPETGSSHLIAVAWHVVALWWWHRRGVGTDDIRLLLSDRTTNAVRVNPTYCAGITCPQDGELNCCPGEPKVHASCAQAVRERNSW